MKKTTPLATPQAQQAIPATTGGNSSPLPRSDESWMRKVRIPPAALIVSPNELTSLTALIAYVASRSGSSEFRVERQVSDRFNVPNVKCLPSSSYDDAIRYLVDSINGIVRL